MIDAGGEADQDSMKSSVSRYIDRLGTRDFLARAFCMKQCSRTRDPDPAKWQRWLESEPRAPRWAPPEA